MVAWYHGTMVLWHYGTMVPWYHGTIIPYIHVVGIRKCAKYLIDEEFSPSARGGGAASPLLMQRSLRLGLAGCEYFGICI